MEDTYPRFWQVVSGPVTDVLSVRRGMQRRALGYFSLRKGLPALPSDDRVWYCCPGAARLFKEDDDADTAEPQQST